MRGVGGADGEDGFASSTEPSGRNHSDGNRVDVQDERGGANGVQEIVLDVGSDSDLLDGNRQMHLFQIRLLLEYSLLACSKGRASQRTWRTVSP